MYLNIQKYALKSSKDLLEFSQHKKSLLFHPSKKPRSGNLKFTFECLYLVIFIFSSAKIICSKSQLPKSEPYFVKPNIYLKYVVHYGLSNVCSLCYKLYTRKQLFFAFFLFIFNSIYVWL